MQFLYEFLPVLLFFIAFKFYGIYAATIVGMAATLLQVLLTKIVTKIWDRKQVITLVVFFVFGSMTLYFHNPIFVKWKPTIIFWIFSLIILGSQFLTPKPIMQRFLEHLLEGGKQAIPAKIWRNLNVIWALFFLALGSINLYIAYNFSNDAWVNFKFYGITAALFFLSIFQAFYLFKFLPETKN